MRYTKEQRDYIKEIAPGRYNDEITQLYNDKFGTSLTKTQIKIFKNNHGIKSNVPKHKANEDAGLFNKEQKIFIKDHVKGLLNKDLADLINKTFNLSITAKQINGYKKRHGLTSDIDLKFKKGNSPINKGTKGIYNVGGNKTSFKKGQRPANYKPVGYERIDRDGYVLVKVQDDGPWNKRWRHKHRVLWESHNGPVPHGYVLLFADGNKQHITLDNLIVISQKQLCVINKQGLIQNDADLTKAGLLIADLKIKISERKKVKSRSD